MKAILNWLDAAHDKTIDRSNLIAEALRYFFATHQTIDTELEQINGYADELNQAAEDVLNYQVIR